PPAIYTSPAPASTKRQAMFTASNPEPHCLSMVTPGISNGKRAVNKLSLAILPPGPMALPKITSSISCGFIAVSLMSSSMSAAAYFSCGTFLNITPTLPVAVRFANTITGLFMLSTSPFLYQYFYGQFYLSMYTENGQQLHIYEDVYRMQYVVYKIFLIASYPPNPSIG